jgi:catechol-2,3-dioxygenase
VRLRNKPRLAQAFKVSSLAEFRSFHARVVEKSIPIKFVFNHGVSFAFYFDDPDGNMIEVYWPTGDDNGWIGSRGSWKVLEKTPGKT